MLKNQPKGYNTNNTSIIKINPLPKLYYRNKISDE